MTREREVPAAGPADAESAERAHEPAVSVVLPTRDRRHALERAVESVRRQTISAWELVIVDDGSSDGTQEIIARLAREDDRIRGIRLDPAEGAPAARNQGIGEARAPIIAFLDDDDVWMEDKLRRQLARLEAAGPEAGVCYGPHWQVWPDGSTQYVSAGDLSTESLRKLAGGAFIGTPSILVRRRCLYEVGGFDRALPRLQDWDLLLRLARATGFVCTSRPVYYAYYTAGGISRKPEQLQRACRLIAHKAERWPELGPRGRAALWATLGHLLLSEGQVPAGRRYYRASLREAPLRIQTAVLTGLAHLWPGGYRLATGIHGRLVRIWRRSSAPRWIR